MQHFLAANKANPRLGKLVVEVDIAYQTRFGVWARMIALEAHRAAKLGKLASRDEPDFVLIVVINNPLTNLIKGNRRLLKRRKVLHKPPDRHSDGQCEVGVWPQAEALRRFACR